jgi:hypothetical protein
MPREQIQVFDDVLADPHAYRNEALALPFGDIQIGPDLFKGIALAPNPAVARALMGHLPDAEPQLSFFRRSPAGQQEPNYIHTDREMGDWTGIYYCNPRPASGDGTIFWERISTGQIYGTWDDPQLRDAVKDPALWRPHRRTYAKFNRLLVFRSDLLHSRALFNNYGTAEGHDARLVQVLFGTWRTDFPTPHAPEPAA